MAPFLMRDGDTDTTTIELLPTPASTLPPSYTGDESTETIDAGLLPTSKKDSLSDKDDHEPASRKPWPAWMLFRDWQEVSSFLIVLATSIPVILLAKAAPSLSTRLSSSACLPSGDFVFPGTVSVWDPAYLFTVTITLQGHVGPDDLPWTYKRVKIIDLVWDTLAGKGGQLILIYIAYRVFSRVLERAMETRPVPYQTYSAIAFSTGTVKSIWYVTRGLFTDPRPAWRSYPSFLAITVATLYIVSMPTLFSAMTGYAAVFEPWVEVPPEPYLNPTPTQGTPSSYDCATLGQCTLYNCMATDTPVRQSIPANETDAVEGTQIVGYGLQPAWGVLINGSSINLDTPYPILASEPVDGYYIIQYYLMYQKQYEALQNDPECRDISSLSDCPATNISSVMFDPDDPYQSSIHLEPPLLNIQTYGNNSATGIPDVWLCNNMILYQKDFNAGNITGICKPAINPWTGTEYQWGFSFLLLFIVCTMNLVFAVLMFTLWITARRSAPARSKAREKTVGTRERPATWRRSHFPSVMSSVVAMAGQVREDHGDEVFGWSAETLRSRVWDSKEGVRMRRVRKVSEA